MKYFTPERLEYFKKAYRELKKYKKWTILSIVFGVAASIFEGFSLGTIIPFFQGIMDPESITKLAIPFLGEWQKAFLNGKREDVILILMVFALIMVALKSIFTYLKTLAISRAGTAIRRDLQDEMFNATCEANLKFSYRIKTGNLVSSISTFTKSIVAFYFTLLDLISRLSKVIIYAILLVFVSWKFTIVALVLEAAILPMIKRVFAKIKRVSIYATVESANLNSQMIEKLSNVKLIKIFTAEEREKKLFHRISTSLADLDYKNDAYEAIIGPISEITVMGAIVTIFAFVIKVWGLNIVFYLPLLIAYLYIFMKIFNEVSSILKATARLFQFLEPYKAYENLLSEARANRAQNGTQKISGFQEKITLENVSFGYENEEILKNINLTIPKGSFTALVGPTGAGKTTLANLIAGLILPRAGKLMIDEQEIHNLDTKTWRQRLGFISQDVVILNDTAAQNIAYGSWQADKEAITQAAKIAKIEDFIEGLPKKYETILGEKGERLSGGQRQRIAIARAVIKNPEVLILDEATSALDTETEKAIQESLDKILDNKTIIAIAHRLSTIKKADNIVVLSNGQIVEQGSHAELLKNGKIYKKYYEQQFED